MELLTYAEAAKLTELSLKTIQRHVYKKKLEHIDTPLGPRIPRVALEPYLDLLRTPKATPSEDLSPLSETPQEPAGDLLRHSATQSLSVPLEAHLAALELAGKQLERLTIQYKEERLRADQAERTKTAIEGQLAQYQRALSESAESLAGERAKRVTAEAQAAEPRGIWSKFRRILNGKRAKEA